MNALAEYLKKHRSYYTIVVPPDLSQVFDMTAPKQFFICLERNHEKLAIKNMKSCKEPMLFEVQFQTTHKRELGERENIFLRFIYTEILNTMFL